MLPQAFTHWTIFLSQFCPSCPTSGQNSIAPPHLVSSWSVIPLQLNTLCSFVSLLDDSIIIPCPVVRYIWPSSYSWCMCICQLCAQLQEEAAPSTGHWLNAFPLIVKRRGPEVKHVHSSVHQAEMPSVCLTSLSGFFFWLSLLTGVDPLCTI